MFEAILAKAFLAKAATVLAGLSLATTGAGAADVLPQPAQDRVAATVEKVSALDLPDSQDPAGAAETPKDTNAADPVTPDDEVDKVEEVEKHEKAEKPEQAKDNFGQIVSARARSTEDKGREFGQSVSAEARARAAARQESKPADDADAETDDGTDEDGTPAAKGSGPLANPGAQGNRGPGHRR